MKNFLSILILFSVFIGLFTGCTSTETDTRSTVLVLGAHRNFPTINLNAQDIYNNIYDTSYSYGSVSVVVVDGEPYLFADYKFTAPDKNIDNSKRKQIAKENTEQIIHESHNAIAKTPEFDTLKALIMAANSLSSKGATSSCLLMYDSGFSTTGLLNFAKENLINVEPVDIVSRLQELHAIPNLSGINVLWTGCGEVSGSQTKLTENYKHKLKAIWQAIVEAGGGSVYFDKSPLSNDATSTNLPDCSTIPIIEDSLGLAGADLSNPIRFDENSSIKFFPDKADFIDPAAALNELRPIAESLTKNPKSILIAGTTASAGSSEYRFNLSNRRAEACKAALISLGVSGDNITTIGIGNKECSLHVNDINADGTLNEKLAPQNRAVYIMDSNSNIAKEIMKLN